MPVFSFTASFYREIFVCDPEKYAFFYVAVKSIDEDEATNKLNNINKYIDATVNSLVIENKEAASKLYC